MPIHYAILRTVVSGREAEFESALRDFHAMDRPGSEAFFLSPGDGSREYGILRTFGSEEAAEKFYDSPEFKSWEDSIASLVEDKARRNRIHGLSAFFPESGPPDWKMAVVTYFGVVPSVYFSAALVSGGASLRMSAMGLVEFLMVNALVVSLLTWVVMPVLIKIFRKFLTRNSHD